MCIFASPQKIAMNPTRNIWIVQHDQAAVEAYFCEVPILVKLNDSGLQLRIASTLV